MRGIAMVLMASDHASGAFNAGRLVTDSVYLYDPQSQLGTLHFLYRWLSHLCAPTFLFLAGTALALSIGRKMQRGVSAAVIDRDLLIRGLLILSVDLAILNWFWVPEYFLLQVMYAIGLAMVLMIPLRRMPPLLLIALAMGTLVGGELFRGDAIVVPLEPIAVANAFLLGVGIIDTPLESLWLFAKIGVPDQVLTLYPVLPWWAMMALGWAFGSYLRRNGAESAARWSAARLLMIWGGGGLFIFALLRGVNGFGNLALLRLDGSLIQWLHVSKYPPSIAFVALELGLMALILAGLFRVQKAAGDQIRIHNPLLLFGQTAFFFYVGHIVILETAARLLGVHEQGGLVESMVATVAVLVILYPLCLWYRQYKAGHPRSLTRFF